MLRDRAGLALDDLGAPMDVLWFRLSRAPGDSSESIGHFEPGRLLVQINRGSYWQCAIVIPKGAADAVRERGLDAFRAHVTEVLPWAGVRIGEDIKTWDDVKLLSVRVDRLRQWYKPGLLFIGDALPMPCRPLAAWASTSPFRDAVAAANPLAAIEG